MNFEHRYGAFNYIFDLKIIINFVFYSEKVCCGIIFKGLHGEVIVDPRFITPCKNSKRRNQQAPVDVDLNDKPSSLAPMDSSITHTSSIISPSARGIQSSVIQTQVVGKTKAFSDTSSDSGYDESSNQGEISVVGIAMGISNNQQTGLSGQN